jgi:hypothetical protein
VCSGRQEHRNEDDVSLVYAFGQKHGGPNRGKKKAEVW